MTRFWSLVVFEGYSDISDFFTGVGTINNDIPIRNIIWLLKDNKIVISLGIQPIKTSH